MKASREILVSRADVVSDSVLARKVFHPTVPQWLAASGDSLVHPT